MPDMTFQRELPGQAKLEDSALFAKSAMQESGISETQSSQYAAPMIGVKHSSNLGELAQALAKAQLEFEPVKKDTENPYYRSKYADLSAIIAATQKHLAKYGLVIIQSPIVDVRKQEAGVHSLMVHSSGQWMSSELILPATMLGKDGRPRFDSQSAGSAQTYARRYSYQALVGVAAEPDDDGNNSLGIGSAAAAQEVAKQKIALAASAGSKTAQKAQERNHVPIRVDRLLYTFPPRHNGNKAEFVNVAAYIQSNQDRDNEVRFAFSAVGATKTKDETALVPTEKLPDLLNVLNGDLGITVQQLQPA